MPYPTGHREQVRSRIVESARRLFNRNGFESVSVDSIMGQAGLTRGAFYAYFESKSDLYAEILGCFFTDPNWKSRWEGVDVDLASPEVGPQIVRAYLSQQHFDDVENSCPMVALVVRQYSVRRKRLDSHHHIVQESRPMPTLALFLVRFARLLFSGHAAVATENAALRLQLAGFQLQRRRPVLTSLDRLFWVGLSLLWKRWRAPLMYVQADTVVRWQRERFRRF